MSVDVVGYSPLMSYNEHATAATITVFRSIISANIKGIVGRDGPRICLVAGARDYDRTRVSPAQATGWWPVRE